MTVHNRLGPPLRATFGADLPPFPPPRHMRRRPVRRLVAVGLLMVSLAAGCLAGMACQPVDGECGGETDCSQAGS